MQDAGMNKVFGIIARREFPTLRVFWGKAKVQVFGGLIGGEALQFVHVCGGNIPFLENSLTPW